MPLETIYVTRHGFRSNWLVDPATGVYTASIPSPTGIPADPALTSHGVNQAKELGRHLMTLDPPIEAVYSSPFYRCLQTMGPFIELQKQQSQQGSQELQEQGQNASSGSQGDSTPTGETGRKAAAPAATKIRPEHGLREWFGSAPFQHPQPAAPKVLKGMFPAYDEDYVSALVPSSKGETLLQIQDRIAAAMKSIIDRCDADGTRAIVLCSHAAVIILLGRVLTGRFPDSVETDDFRAFTCGLSVYQRRSAGSAEKSQRQDSPPAFSGNAHAVDPIGDWDCTVNGDCSFLSGGEERGWKFAGDESFPGTGSVSQTDNDSKL